MDLKLYCRMMFFEFIIASAISLLFSFIAFLGLLVVVLVYLYLLVRKDQLRTLLETFQLGRQYPEEEYITSILYFIGFLYHTYE